MKTEKRAEDRMVLKMLIPVEYLKRGQDPLAHALLTFFNPKPVDAKKAASVESFIDEGFNRIQYEIDRFRSTFPKPLDNAKVVKGETVRTDAGLFENCEVITGTTGYDGPLLANGRMVFKGTYRIVVNPKAPFGVVAMEAQVEVREMSETTVASLSGSVQMKLTKTGQGAVSDLPDKGKRNSNK